MLIQKVVVLKTTTLLFYHTSLMLVSGLLG